MEGGPRERWGARGAAKGALNPAAPPASTVDCGAPSATEGCVGTHSSAHLYGLTVQD